MSIETEDEEATLTTTTQHDNTTLGRSNVRDKYGLVKVSFLIFGIVIMLPFTVLGTPKSYWMYKFRNVSSNNSYLDDNHKTELQTYFFSYINICSFASGLVTMVICILVGQKVSEYIRNVVSLIGLLLCFVGVTASIYINSDQAQVTFLWLILGSVIAMNFFGTVFQATVSSVIAKFPPEYVHSLVSAQTLAGILVVSMNILIILMNLSVLTSALVFFLITDIGIFLALALYIYVNTTQFFTHYDSQKKTEVEEVASFSALSKSIKLYWPEAITAFLTYTGSVAILPVIMQIESTSNGSVLWREKLFTQVFGLLNAYSLDFTGRKIAGHLPLNRPKLLLALSVLRFAFVPGFFFSNVTPRANWPVYLSDDYAFLALVATFSLTGGYLAAIPMFASNKAEETLRESTTLLVIAGTIVGTTLGAVLSWVILTILSNGM